MFDLIFYRDTSGKSEIVDYLDALQNISNKDKHARINRQKILAYMAALSEHGTRLGEPFVKHLVGDIWEPRPLRNRIFFFCWKGNQIVLLHHFLKKSQKTPKRELEQAIRNRKDFLERSEKR